MRQFNQILNFPQVKIRKKIKDQIKGPQVLLKFNKFFGFFFKNKKNLSGFSKWGFFQNLIA